MPEALNRAPRGLQGFLDPQSQGVNPRIFGDVVSPTMDMTPFFEADIPIEFKFAAGGPQVLPTSLGPQTIPRITVPQGELWLIDGAQLEGLILLATTNLWLGIAKSENNDFGSGEYTTIASTPFPISYTAAELPTVVWRPQRFYIARGGTSFAGSLLGGTVGTVVLTLTLAVRVIRQ